MIADKFLHDTTPPETGVAVLAPTPGRRGVQVALVGACDMSAIRDYDVQVSVDGGAWTAWLTRTTGTSGDPPRPRRSRAMPFRARATRRQGQRRGLGRRRSLPDADAEPGDGRLRARSARRPLDGPQPARHRRVEPGQAGRAATSSRSPAGRSRRRLHLVPGQRAAHHLGAGPSRSGAAGWVAAAQRSRAYLAPRTAPNTTLVDAGIAGLVLRIGRRPPRSGPSAERRSRRGRSRPTATARRTDSPSTGRTASALDGLTLRVLRRRRRRCSAPRAVPDRGPGAQAWTWDGTVGGRRLPDGRYLLQLVGRGRRPDLQRPVGGPVQPGPGRARSPSRSTPVAADDRHGDRLGAASSRRTATVASTPSPVSATTTGDATRWRLSAAAGRRLGRRADPDDRRRRRRRREPPGTAGPTPAPSPRTAAIG